MDTICYLQHRGASFQVVPHAEAYDANHLAQATHTPGGEVAKAVLLRANHGGRYLVAVLPSTYRVDLEALSRAIGATSVELATELEVGEHCPECEFGVISPFGSRYGFETFVDRSLATDEEILFEGDTHHEAIRMTYSDYCSIERPLVAKFAIRR